LLGKPIDGHGTICIGTNVIKFKNFGNVLSINFKMIYDLALYGWQGKKVKKPIKMYHPILKSQVPLPIIQSITMEVGLGHDPLTCVIILIVIKNDIFSPKPLGVYHINEHMLMPIDINGCLLCFCNLPKVIQCY
jgi:hypothetical protein